jgi:hypothetical protein
MTGETRSCGNCGHSEPVALQPSAVECRINPPVVMVLPGHGFVAVFPQVVKGSRCSKWVSQGAEIRTGAASKTAEKPGGKTDGTT